MKNLSIYILLLFLITLSCEQKRAVSQKDGYPDRSATLDVLPGFKSPPKGYGEVPFYWWYKDSLTKEQLAAKLDMLKEMKISSLQVNYCHIDTGGNTYGLSAPSKPALFTDEWWDLFGWFMGEAKKRGMTVSLSDYTLGVGQGYTLDEVLKEHPEIMGSELQFLKQDFSDKLSFTLPAKPLSLIAYKKTSSGDIEIGTEVDLMPKLVNNKIDWNAPAGKWVLTCVYDKKKEPSYDPMHPLSGKMYVQKFFQRFEDKFPEQSKGGLNFFFSDELEFHLRGYFWNDLFKEEFMKRKHYDVTPYLAGLFMNVGDITPKIRLDYNDVMTSLSEENFFKPVYDWHNDRGLIYGCDHGGRGRDVVEFGDYFRTQRWNQGPGSDQPMLQKDVIKAKVASSIANMYERPRVWLEGFHSSGWATNTAQLTDAIFANYAMGYNLLSLHGLYYNTLGGWWEWAPPCNHFHMPYWQQMKSLLGCTERLSYLLSQGHHVSDVAILYPVESVIAGYGNRAVDATFALANKLYSDGLDYDFMDYESLQRAEVKDGKLNVSGMSFKVLIFPSMKAVKHTSLLKALEFKKAGGTVICMGDLPEASDREGLNDDEVKQLVKQLFMDNKGIHLSDESAVLNHITTAFTRDFNVVSSSEDTAPYIMHRKMGPRDVYAVYNVAKRSECFFRSKGGVELWNPWTGETSPLAASRVTEEGTYISMPLDKTDFQLIVFNPDKKVTIAQPSNENTLSSILLPNEWEFELLPTLDNQWGDFHWPATKALIGAEVRSLKYTQTNDLQATLQDPLLDDSDWKKQSLGFGAKCMILEALRNPIDERTLVANISKYPWQPYDFSWRWGVENDPGHQGYHGLKGHIYDDFIRLGALGEDKHSKIRVKDERGDNYYLYTYLYADHAGEYEVNTGDILPVYTYLNGEKVSVDRNRKVTLKQGPNLLLLHYKGACTTYFVVQDTNESRILEDAIAEHPLSMKWNGDLSVLPMGVEGSNAMNGWYRFKSAPGLKKLSLQAYGNDLSVWSDGEVCEVTKGISRADGLTSYEVIIPNQKPNSTVISIKITGLKPGFVGGAAIPNPIKEECGKGVITIGDWSQIEGLTSYSGGVSYSQQINIDASMKGKKLLLDLGDVVSTAEVWVNGKKVGLRLTPPWQFDLSNAVKQGKNELKVIVHNTVSNHYVSIPTSYRGSLKSGLIGPVNLIQQ